MKKTKLFSVLLLGLLVAGGTSALALAHDDGPIRTEAAAAAAIEDKDFTFLIKNGGVADFDKLTIETFDPSQPDSKQDGNTIEKVDDTTYKVTILSEYFRNKAYANVRMNIKFGGRELVDSDSCPAKFSYQPFAGLNNTETLVMNAYNYGANFSYSINMRNVTPTTKQGSETTRLWFDCSAYPSHSCMFASNGKEGFHSFAPAGTANFGSTDKPLNYTYFDVPISLLQKNETNEFYEYRLKSGPTDVKQLTCDILDWTALHRKDSYGGVRFASAFDSNKVLANKDALVEVFKPYYTCLDNNYNGFGAIKNLVKYWITCSGLTEEDLNAIKIMDFAKNEDYATDTRSSEITLNQKINEMTNQYNIKQSLPAQGYLPVDDQKMITVIIATSISAITAIALVTFTIARKKRLSK